MLGTKQTAGDNSTQINNANSIIITNGMGYSEAKDLVITLFENNMLKLTEEAKKKAMERIDEFVGEYFKKAIKEKIDTAIFTEPDFQYSYFEAQNIYARSNKEELKHMLTDALIKKSKHSENAIQILLNNAINIISKLTVTQIEILALSFIVTGVVYPINDKKILKMNLLSSISIFKKELKHNLIDLEHIVSCGCARFYSYEKKTNLQSEIKNNYKNIFNDISEEEIESFILESPNADIINKNWENYMSSLILTPLGKVIAILYLETKDNSRRYSLDVFVNLK